MARTRKTCARETCGRRTSSGRSFCTPLCRAITVELDRAQRVCQALGAQTPLVSQLWAEAVALNDGYTKLREIDRQLYEQAQSVGFTAEQWRAVKEGKTG